MPLQAKPFVKLNIPADKYNAVFKAWVERAKGQLQTMLQAHTKGDLPTFKYFVQKMDLELEDLKNFVVNFSQFFPKSQTFKKAYEWGETRHLYSSILGRNNMMDNIFVDVYILARYNEDLYSYMTRDEDHNQILHSTPEGGVASYKLPDGRYTGREQKTLRRLIGEITQWVEQVSKDWKANFQQMKIQKKLTYSQLIDVGPFSVELIHANAEPDPALESSIRATLNAIKVVASRMTQQGFAKHLATANYVVHASQESMRRAYTGSGFNPSRTFAFYTPSTKTINMPLIRKESSTRYFISAFIHEIAHHFQYRLSSQGAKEWLELFNKLKELRATKRLTVASDYAYTDEGEMFAELVAYLLYPQSTHYRIPQDVLEAVRYFFNTYLGAKFNEHKRIPYRQRHQHA